MPEDKTFAVRLIAISPIHIGCDDAYDPTTFRIDEANKKLVHFKPLDFMKQLTGEQRGKFSELCNKGTLESLLEIFKFIGATQVQGKSVELCAGFVEHYKSIRTKNQMKQFVINRTVYNLNSRQPYIPGSSLKGSLRTAYLNLLASEKKGSTTDAKRLEERILGGSFDTDPLRFLHVSDLQPKSISRKILYAVNKKKKTSKYEAHGPFQILETIEPGSEFVGTMRFVHPLEPGRISDAMERFYSSLFDEEGRILTEIGHEPKSARQDVEKHKTEKGKRNLVRLGRHSGAEAVTIEGYREIKIMKNPKPQDHSTTVWLASEEKDPKENGKLLPFGWAILKFAKVG